MFRLTLVDKHPTLVDLLEAWIMAGRIHNGGDHMERLLLGGYMGYFGRRGTLGASMASPLLSMFWLTSRNL